MLDSDEKAANAAQATVMERAWERFNLPLIPAVLIFIFISKQGSESVIEISSYSLGGCVVRLRQHGEPRHQYWFTHGG